MPPIAEPLRRRSRPANVRTRRLATRNVPAHFNPAAIIQIPLRKHTAAATRKTEATEDFSALPLLHEPALIRTTMCLRYIEGNEEVENSRIRHRIHG